jgi:glycosyltransferase involved in cell wall biosynthesis
MTIATVNASDSTDGMVMLASSSTHRDAPAFSICIPQFNRTSFLIEACRSLVAQSFSSFEVCISDDCSTDGREKELASFLESSGLDFKYARQVRNRRYDGNLRGAIALARGEFIFLLGNDDRLAEPDTLERIQEKLIDAAPVQVALTNYAECESGRRFQRVLRPGILGRGPSAAVRAFRDFSFVSGVILNTSAARQWSTDKWDGSEMYQMYLACRILAAGGNLLGIGEICVEKDIRIARESVDSYASVKVAKKDFSPVVLPMAQIAPLVADAIAPYVSRSALEKTTMLIAAQLLVFTYAFWLVELRRAQSWRYAVSVYRGLAPKRILSSSRIGWLNRSLITLLYAAVGVGGLAMPVRVFQYLQPTLYRLAKRRSALSQAGA